MKIKKIFFPKTIDELKEASSFGTALNVFIYFLAIMLELYFLFASPRSDLLKKNIYSFYALVTFIPVFLACVILSLKQKREYQTIQTLEDFKKVSIKYLKKTFLTLSIPVLLTALSIGLTFPIGITIFVALLFLAVLLTLYFTIHWIINHTTLG